MSDNRSRVDDRVTHLVDATVELLWAHRNDVIDGKVAAGQAQLYAALVKSACEALPVSQRDMARLYAVYEEIRLAITTAAACEVEG